VTPAHPSLCARARAQAQLSCRRTCCWRRSWSCPWTFSDYTSHQLFLILFFSSQLFWNFCISFYFKLSAVENEINRVQINWEVGVTRKKGWKATWRKHRSKVYFYGQGHQRKVKERQQRRRRRPVCSFIQFISYIVLINFFDLVRQKSVAFFLS